MSETPKGKESHENEDNLENDEIPPDSDLRNQYLEDLDNEEMQNEINHEKDPNILNKDNEITPFNNEGENYGNVQIKEENNDNNPEKQEKAKIEDKIQTTINDEEQVDENNKEENENIEDENEVNRDYENANENEDEDENINNEEEERDEGQGDEANNEENVDEENNEMNVDENQNEMYEEDIHNYDNVDTQINNQTGNEYNIIQDNNEKDLTNKIQEYQLDQNGQLYPVTVTPTEQINLNQMNQMNQLNQVNQMNQLNQENQMNQVNQVNTVCKVTKLNQVNQVDKVESTYQQEQIFNIPQQGVDNYQYTQNQNQNQNQKQGYQITNLEKPYELTQNQTYQDYQSIPQTQVYETSQQSQNMAYQKYPPYISGQSYNIVQSEQHNFTQLDQTYELGPTSPENAMSGDYQVGQMEQSPGYQIYNNNYQVNKGTENVITQKTVQTTENQNNQVNQSQKYQTRSHTRSELVLEDQVDNSSKSNQMSQFRKGMHQPNSNKEDMTKKKIRKNIEPRDSPSKVYISTFRNSKNSQNLGLSIKNKCFSPENHYTYVTSFRDIVSRRLKSKSVIEKDNLSEFVEIPRDKYEMNADNETIFIEGGMDSGSYRFKGREVLVKDNDIPQGKTKLSLEEIKAEIDQRTNHKKIQRKKYEFTDKYFTLTDLDLSNQKNEKIKDYEKEIERIYGSNGIPGNDKNKNKNANANKSEPSSQAQSKPKPEDDQINSLQQSQPQQSQENNAQQSQPQQSQVDNAQQSQPQKTQVDNAQQSQPNQSEMNNGQQSQSQQSQMKNGQMGNAEQSKQSQMGNVEQSQVQLLSQQGEQIPPQSQLKTEESQLYSQSPKITLKSSGHFQSAVKYEESNSNSNQKTNYEAKITNIKMSFSPIDNYSKYLFEQINKIRVDPLSFIGVIEDSKANIIKHRYGGYIYRDKINIALYQGEPAFNEAIEYLKSTESMGKLEYSPELTAQLPQNEKEIRDKNDLKKKVEKMLEKGQHNIKSYWKDIIKDPEISFLLMIVDDNAANGGRRRRDILNPKMKYIGISSIQINRNFVCYITLSYGLKKKDK